MTELDRQPGRGPDDAWWDALRRVTLRTIDMIQQAARLQPEFADDLATLLGSSRTSQEPISAERAPALSAAEERPLEQSQPHVESASAAEEAPPPPAPAPPQQLAVPAPAVLLGPRVVQPPPSVAYQRWSHAEFDPQRVAFNCRLKARATRWQAERRQRLDAGEDVSAGDRELFTTATENKVFLWMISPVKWRERSTPQSVAIIAGCYDALAEAAELMGLADKLQRQQEPAMRLLAEAQSAVRAAIEDYASTRRDDDQDSTFAWLRRETDARSIYVEYMQLEHPASPENHADLRLRIAAVRQSLDEARGRTQAVDRAIGKVRYHAGRLAQRSPANAEVADLADPDLARVAETVQWLLEQSVPASDLRLREALLPAIDKLGGSRGDDDNGNNALAESAPALARVLEQVQDYLDQAAANEEALQASAANEGSAGDDELVAAARQRVGGRDAVLIGGIPSELHRARLEGGLGLRSLAWVRVQHHESFAAAENAIRQPGVGLVMIMTRWRSHAHGPAARELCRALGIPLVELPGGYNLRQVAHRIVEQVPMKSAANVE